MAGQRCPGLVVVGRGLLGKGRGPRGASPESTGRGLHPEPRPLEEDDIFLAGLFLVEWCGEQGHGWEGCPPGLEGEVLVGDISRDRAWGWEAGVWGRCGAAQDGTQRAAAPRGVLLFAHELVEKQWLLQVK